MTRSFTNGVLIICSGLAAIVFGEWSGVCSAEVGSIFGGGRLTGFGDSSKLNMVSCVRAKEATSPRLTPPLYVLGEMGGSKGKRVALDETGAVRGCCVRFVAPDFMFGDSRGENMGDLGERSSSSW